MTTTYTLNEVDIATVAALTEAVTADPSAALTTWSADVRWTGGFRSEASIGDHTPIPSDEPTGLGGTATAPNPVEQVLGAFGNCLAVGIAANATARNIQIEELSISVTGDLDLRCFLGVTEGHAGFDAIRASVYLDTTAEAEAVDDLIRHVVATSPVGHTLAGAIPVNVTRDE